MLRISLRRELAFAALFFFCVAPPAVGEPRKILAAVGELFSDPWYYLATVNPDAARIVAIRRDESDLELVVVDPQTRRESVVMKGDACWKDE